MSKNYWLLTKEIEEKVRPEVEDFIKNGKNGDRIDLTNKINASQLKELVGKMGYSESETDTNGWELDFWILLDGREEDNFSLMITGTGMTGEVYLCKD